MWIGVGEISCLVWRFVCLLLIVTIVDVVVAFGGLLDFDCGSMVWHFALKVVLF